MKISVVLVRPKVAENIGFVCRAMKTMGFSDLRFVEPPKIHEKTRMTAYQSTEILENASHFNTLDTALEDIDFSVATTASSRGIHYDNVSSNDLLQFLTEKSGFINNVALVFGSEENGLTNEEVGLCDVASSIPMVTTYPSLNLSHSVMVYLYELSRLNISSSSEESIEEEHAYKSFKIKTLKVMDAFDLQENKLLHQRLIDRIPFVNQGDAKLLMSAYRFLLRKLR